MALWALFRFDGVVAPAAPAEPSEGDSGGDDDDPDGLASDLLEPYPEPEPAVVTDDELPGSVEARLRIARRDTFFR